MNTPTPEQVDQLIIDSQMRDPRTPAAVAAGNIEGLHPDVVKVFSKPDVLTPNEEKPQGDSCDLITVLRRLAAYVDMPDDAKLTNPLDLVTELYKRISLEDEIRKVEEGGSWDYCKVAVVDWLKNQRRWIPIHPEAHWYQIGCVPPHFQTRDLMMAGEAHSGNYHLTTYRRYAEKYYCCILSQREVMNQTFIARLPFADDLPLLGVPEAKEVEA